MQDRIFTVLFNNRIRNLLIKKKQKKKQVQKEKEVIFLIQNTLKTVEFLSARFCKCQLLKWITKLLKEMPLKAPPCKL